MQSKVKFVNSNESWNSKRRYKIGAVVSYSGGVYQNATGINSQPGTTSDWMNISANTSSGVDPVLTTAVATGTNQQFTVPAGFVAKSVLKSKGELFKGTEWTQASPGAPVIIIANVTSGNSIYIKP